MQAKGKKRAPLGGLTNGAARCMDTITFPHELILQYVGLTFKVSNSNVLNLENLTCRVINLDGSDSPRNLSPLGIDLQAPAPIASLDDAEMSAK